MGISKTTFTELLKNGQAVHSGVLSIKFIRPKQGDQSLSNQYSIVVSIKVSKLAVIRNLLKRRSRDILQKHKDIIKNPLICAIFLKAGSIRLSYRELESAIVAVFKQAKLLI
ncbi:MAG: ribonuclease P protein component [Candidatus Vogelbacteria bacterium]|nr:ribonuclease P protein component [Candidatus Vogelbacteria bacterium]